MTPGIRCICWLQGMGRPRVTSQKPSGNALLTATVLARSMRVFRVATTQRLRTFGRESRRNANHSAAAGLAVGSTFSLEPLAGVVVGSTFGALSVI